MKIAKLFLLWFGLIIVMKASADIIVPDAHQVASYITISNLDEYPEISLIGAIYPWQGPIISAYVIEPNTWLARGSRMTRFEVFAVRNNYIAGKSITDIDWASDINAFPSSIDLETSLGWIPNSNPLVTTESYFKIAGFTDSSVVMFKWKEIRKYNKGLADSVKTFEYSGNLQSLSQTIPSGIQHQNRYSGIRVYPNPARETITIGSIEGYTGVVKAELVNTNGKVVKLYRLLEGADNSVYPLSISRLSPGLYFLKIHLGEFTEVRKVVVE
jgi:hypothetical protein